MSFQKKQLCYSYTIPTAEKDSIKIIILPEVVELKLYNNPIRLA